MSFPNGGIPQKHKLQKLGLHYKPKTSLGHLSELSPTRPSTPHRTGLAVSSSHLLKMAAAAPHLHTNRSSSSLCHSHRCANLHCCPSPPRWLLPPLTSTSTNAALSYRSMTIPHWRSAPSSLSHIFIHPFPSWHLTYVDGQEAERQIEQLHLSEKATFYIPGQQAELFQEGVFGEATARSNRALVKFATMLPLVIMLVS